MSGELPNEFSAGLQQLGFATHDALLLERLLLYRQELLDWNTRMNLTAITDPGEVLIKHFLDALSLLLVCTDREQQALDIGSGAGFPGLPLAIARPQWRVTLLEATGKRVTFLRHVVQVLRLENVCVVQGRAEELARRQDYRAAFDVVTARAVAALPVLLEYCAPYCRVGGTIILPKKGDIAEELARGRLAAGKVGAVFDRDVPVTLPGLQDGRRLLVWKQRSRSSEQFPRTGSAIAKRPL